MDPPIQRELPMVSLNQPTQNKQGKSSKDPISIVKPTTAIDTSEAEK